jgi:hypothetical protein
MSTITSLQSNGYYSLNNQSSGASSGTAATPGASTILGGTTTATSTAESAYSLDLSPDALAYIKQINGSSAGKASSYASVSNFTLTKDQQTTRDAIIAKYKDAPFTQDTFSQIQDDLNAAGLSPEALGKQDAIRNFNPTKLFLDALNGINSGTDDGSSLFGGSTSSSDDEALTTKSTNFMTGIADQWARISTKANDA